MPNNLQNSCSFTTWVENCALVYTLESHIYKICKHETRKSDFHILIMTYIMNKAIITDIFKSKIEITVYLQIKKRLLSKKCPRKD